MRATPHYKQDDDNTHLQNGVCVGDGSADVDEVVLEGLVDLAPLLLHERAELEHAQLVRRDGAALPRRRQCLQRRDRRR